MVPPVEFGYFGVKWHRGILPSHIIDQEKNYMGGNFEDSPATVQPGTTILPAAIPRVAKPILYNTFIFFILKYLVYNN